MQGYMVTIEVFSPILLAFAPLTVIIYNLLKYADVTKPEDAKEVELAWQQAIRDGKISSSNDYFDTLYEVFVDGIGERPDKMPDYLKVASGEYGFGSEIYCVYESPEEHGEPEELVPLVLADKWVHDYIEGREQRIGKVAYAVATTLLLFGLGVEIYIRL